MRLFYVLFFCSLLGCYAPSDVVVDDGNMVIYAAIHKNHENGKYEYHISDKISDWKLITNEKFNVGDKVKISLSLAGEGTEP